MEVPEGVVTDATTVPAESAGAMTVIWVSEFIVKAAGIPPMRTAVVPVKPLPVIITALPPLMEPEDGLIPAVGTTAVAVLSDSQGDLGSFRSFAEALLTTI